ncbi:MAG: antibiotic biosynthesis monooxygenase [Candidatus Aquilonibacter sp.]|jgi:quinol monooxygenase YgiN
MLDVKTTFIAALVFTIDPKDVVTFGEAAAQLVQRRGSAAPGFIESVVMADETKTQVLVVTQWESRHAWAQAHWDQDIGNGIVALVESATSFDVRSYDPIAVVRRATA